MTIFEYQVIYATIFGKINGPNLFIFVTPKVIITKLKFIYKNDNVLMLHHKKRKEKKNYNHQ